MRLMASLGFEHSVVLRQLKLSQAQRRQQSVCLESLENLLKKDRHKQNQTAQTKINRGSQCTQIVTFLRVSETFRKI